MNPGEEQVDGRLRKEVIRTDPPSSPCGFGRIHAAADEHATTTAKLAVRPDDFTSEPVIEPQVHNHHIETLRKIVDTREGLMHAGHRGDLVAFLSDQACKKKS